MNPALLTSLNAPNGNELRVRLTVMKTFGTAPGEDEAVPVGVGDRIGVAVCDPPELKLTVQVSEGRTLSLNVHPK